MFEKFTERARKVMSLSRQHAQRLNHEFIGTEHMLLAVLDEDGGVAAKALKLLGVDKRVMMKAIEIKAQPNALPACTLGQLPFSPRAKKVLQLSEEEASRCGAQVIGTEHLLLGLFMEREGLSFQVLSDFKITEQDLRTKLKEVLGTEDGRVFGEPEPQGATVSFRVWIFKPYDGTSKAPSEGSLFCNNVRMEVSLLITMEGIPFAKRDIIAASLAKDCEAAAYMVELLKR